ncbi:MAG: DUF4189 domain-containing protein [Xanthobacteraceae bacterium]|nr:DUF4189 domain-containing protein [Xanthobacteraceae bacterium]
MATFGRAAARIAVAGAFVLAMVGLVHAAGALAIGPCGAYGVAYDQPGAEAARAEAMRKCTGKGCRVVASTNMNCAAFAVDMRNACGSYGFAAAARLGPAQNAALKQCYSNGGKDCVIRAFVCDAKG